MRQPHVFCAPTREHSGHAGEKPLHPSVHILPGRPSASSPNCWPTCVRRIAAGGQSSVSSNPVSKHRFSRSRNSCSDGPPARWFKRQPFRIAPATSQRLRLCASHVAPHPLTTPCELRTMGLSMKSPHCSPRRLQERPGRLPPGRAIGAGGSGARAGSGSALREGAARAASVASSSSKTSAVAGPTSPFAATSSRSEAGHVTTDSSLSDRLPGITSLAPLLASCCSESRAAFALFVLLLLETRPFFGRCSCLAFCRLACEARTHPLRPHR